MRTRETHGRAGVSRVAAKGSNHIGDRTVGGTLSGVAGAPNIIAAAGGLTWA